jgi:hypothetical protein
MSIIFSCNGQGTGTNLDPCILLLSGVPDG